MAFDREIVALIIAAEASSEPEDCQLGIAWAIKNRLATRRYGETLAEVCLQRKQFSEMNDDPINNANLRRVARLPMASREIVSALVAADDMIAGESPDPTFGATHFFEISIPVPYWAKAPAVHTVTLGSVSFWKDVP